MGGRAGQGLAPARVYVREPRPTDCDAFLAMVAASRSYHHPWVDPPSTREEFAAYLSRRRAVDQLGFFAFSAADDELVGVINVSEIVRGNFQSAYLGYYGSARHAGAGLMSEAMEQVLHRAFAELALHRLEANIQPDNARSRALARRCGFRLEGFSPRYLRVGTSWCDHERWAMTVEDWRARRRVQRGAP